jgi:hypothetical protein
VATLQHHQLSPELIRLSEIASMCERVCVYCGQISLNVAGYSKSQGLLDQMG